MSAAAIRTQLRSNAAQFLHSDETIQAVFPAEYFALGSRWIIVSKNSPRVVIVTDRRILVCQGSHLGTTVIKRVLAELPRATRLGPSTGRYSECEALGRHVYVHKRFRDDVAYADAFLERGVIDGS